MSLAERFLVGSSTSKFDVLQTLELVKKPIPPLRWFAGLVILEDTPLQIRSILYNDQVLAGEIIDHLNNWANYAVVNPLEDYHTQNRYQRAHEAMITAQKKVKEELDYTPGQLYEYSVFLESKLVGLNLDQYLPLPTNNVTEGVLDLRKLGLFKAAGKGTQLRICFL